MIVTLTARHLRIFFRERTNVFFALLGPLILFALYKLFLGNMQIDGLANEWPTASRGDIARFIDAWVIAGTVMITTLTTSLAALGVFVDDRTSGRFADFVVSPLRQRDMIVGYLLAAFVIAALLSILVLAAGCGYLAIVGAPLPEAGELLRVVGFVLVMCLAFASVASFAVTFVASTGAFSSLSTLVGTFAGFLAMAYIPPVGLPDSVVRVLNYLPFAQSAMLARGPLTAPALDALVAQAPDARPAIIEAYGLDPLLGMTPVAPLVLVGILLAIAVIFGAFGTWRIGRLVG